MIVGNDIASFQGDINWDVYKNNSNFVIIKTTEGNGFVDPKFRQNLQGARSVGLPLGFYHFARPDLNADANVEADFFLLTIGQIKDGEVLCLDYEPNWNGDAVAWCKKFLDRVLEKTGVKAFIYLNQSQVQRYNWKAVSDVGYALWIAAYTGSPTNNDFATGSFGKAAMQQWTSVQHVPGIQNGQGNVDGDVFFGDVETFKKYGYKSAVQPTDWKQKYEESQAEVKRLGTVITGNNEVILTLQTKINKARQDLS